MGWLFEPASLMTWLAVATTKPSRIAAIQPVPGVCPKRTASSDFLDCRHIRTHLGWEHRSRGTGIAPRDNPSEEQRSLLHTRKPDVHLVILERASPPFVTCHGL